MSVKTIRVSKTSFKEWTLYGPIDQALKTSTQAEAVKAISIHLDSVHGSPVDLELWVNVEAAQLGGEDELNAHAQMILSQLEWAKQGITAEEAFEAGYELPEIPVIKGVAVLTGPGGSEFPQEHMECILAALMGAHPTQ